MENFVLNLFSDQLSKVILDFHEVDINASLLSGKGSIRNIKLNVHVLNELLRTTVPFLQFTEITLTELRVEVTSYTNLKKAPIVLVIDEIYAKAREPLEYHVVEGDNASSNKNPPNNTAGRNPQQKQTPTPPTQPYGLLHRILDNLSFRINHIHLSFSSLGKFKTRTPGPWTPPTLQVTFDNVEWICVTETGMGGTPEAVWAHNELSAQQSRWHQQNQRSRHRSYVIYKKLSMMCHVKLVTGDDSKMMDGDAMTKKKNGSPSSKKKNEKLSPSKSSSSSSTAPSATAASSSTLLSNTRVDVYLSYVRRLRDAAITGADVDITVHNVDIIVDVASYKRSSGGGDGSGNTATTLTDHSSDVCDLGAFVHMLLGLLHCYYKDRSFVDPFLSSTLKKMEDGSTLLRGFGHSSSHKPEKEKREEEPEAGPDDFLPTVAIMDDDLDSSDEEHDYEKEEEEEEQREAAAAAASGSSVEEGQEGGTASKEEGGKAQVLLSEGASEAAHEKAIPNSDAKEGEEGGGDDAMAKKYERKRKAVVVLASGAQKFEKLSFSFSMPRLNMKLCLPSDDEKEGSSEEEEEGTHHQPTEKHDHCLELLLEGLIVECIWPKNLAGEMGGHVQGSIHYFHVLNSVFHKEWGGNSGGSGGASGPKPWNVAKIYPLCRVGKRLFRGHNAFALASKLNPFAGEDKKDNYTKCDEFPLMESRRLSWTWNRSLHGPRAFAFKSTISFVDEALTKWSKTNVVHEASLGEVEVVFNSVPLGRLANLFTEDNVWLDKRWISGHWNEELPKDITTAAEFCLKDYLQPLPSFTPTGSKSSPLSSELRSITVHLDSITVRLPNPLLDLSTFRCADVIFGISEATVLVSSDLPSSFLAGTVAAEGNPSEFPHDPSDISCGANSNELTSAGDAKFRMQISLSDCSLAVVPIQAYALDRGECRFTYLISPTKITSMLSLSHSDNNSTAITSDASTASHSLIVSVLVHQLDSNIEVRSIYGAFETLHYHTANITREQYSSLSSDSTALGLSVSQSKEEDVNPSKSFLVICIHVPASEVTIWGEQSAAMSLQHHKLCQAKVSQFEFGVESTTHLLPQGKQTTAAVIKCSIPSFGVDICSRGKDGGELKMVELLSMGLQSTSSSHDLIEKVYAFCSSSHDAVEKVSKAGFVLRSDDASAGSVSTNCNSVEIGTPLVVDLDIEAIECFFNLFVECLLSPVFVSCGRHLGSSQTPLGSALWSTALALFSSSKDEGPAETKSNKVGGSALFRLSLRQMLVLVPSIGEQSSDSFCFHSNGIEVAIGDCQHRGSTDDSDSSCYKEMIQKLCGSDGQSWLQTYQLGSGTDTGTFIVLRSKHIVLGLGSSEQAQEDVQFNVIVPESCINWALPEVAGASTSAPPFDVFAMKDLGLTFMYGSYPLSQLYFKLYKLSPKRKSARSEFSLAATRLHNLVGTYHCKMNAVMGQLNTEVDRLRRTLFFKERERVGALALASSTASGWIRVGEAMSFSHRIFSSATFFRYWMVLDRSLIILYDSPGDTKPALIVPLRASSELRSLSLSSSSIVGNHMQQKGFALFDSEEGYGLFFATASNADYRMWTQAISSVLKTGTITPLEPTESQDTLSAVKYQAETQETSPAQHVDPFPVAHGAPAPSELQQAPGPDVPAGSFETNQPDIAPAPPNEDCPDPISSLDNSDFMADVDMEEISLGGTEEVLDEPSPSADNPPGAPPPPPPPPPQLSSTNRDRTPNLQPVPIRERLAFAKGKSKIASARFGSALKSAKGGVLAASEKSREGIKQAMKETSRKDELSRRSLAVGQKMAMLKKNAADALQPSSSSDEIPGSAKQVVGQKMSLLKKNAGTKLTSLSTTVRSSANEHTTAKANDTSQPANESQDELTVNRSGRQEIRKKIDQSMKLLKIDEKIAAVKSGVRNDPMMKQLSNVSFSRHSEQPRQRLGVADKERTIKPIKFDARQTFGSSSLLPLKVKSVLSGEALLIDDDLLEKVESLQKIGGSWAVSVDLIKVAENGSLNAEIMSDNAAVLQPPSNLRSNSSLDDEWKYRISTTNLLGGSNGHSQALVTRSTSEVLMFHTTISEIIAKSLPQSAEVVAQEAFQHADSSNPILTKLSPFERLRVSGDTLQRLSKNSPSATNCLLIKVFITILLECHMPSQAMDATRAFLNVAAAQPEDLSMSNLASGSTAVEEAFDHLSQATSSEKQYPSLPSSKVIESELDGRSSTSSLLKVIMDGYTKAMKERDEALASLATTTIISDNKIMQEQLSKSNAVSGTQGSKGRLTRTNSSDEDTVNLCKQLGNEISLRTAAESEINRLKEQLEFERKIAQTKEDNMRRSLAQTNTSTDSDNTNR